MDRRKKIKEDKSEWAELLNEVLWAYRRTQNFHCKPEVL